MYENITYAELKKLPKEQKPEAWKELKYLYKTQKELAEKLGVGTAVVYNMIARYVGSEKKAVKLEVVEKPKKSRRRAEKQINRAQEIEAPGIIMIAPETVNEAFSISIKKTVSGEDAQYFFNGIGVTLLKGQQYTIEIKITEK